MEQQTITNNPRPPMEEERETLRKANDLIAQMQMDTLKTFPMEMRLNYLLNIISKGMKRNETEDKEAFNSNINWKTVNEILNLDRSSDDFNIFGEIKTIQELIELRETVMYASCGLGPWQKKICRDCGKEFCLDKGQIDFFRGRSLAVPTRCGSCRQKRKNKTK